MNSEEINQLVQIGGLIRFSIPTLTGFQKNPETIAEKLAKLYAPERMEQRFGYFEKMCLHTLKQQTDPNFTIGILVGEDMPEAYRRQLDLLLKDVPQAKVIEKPVMNQRAAVKEGYEAVFDQGTPFRLSFRLDDDDAVALDFIEQARAKLPQMLLISGGMDPVLLWFSNGMTMMGEGRERHIVQGRERSPISAGLAVLAPAELGPLVMQYPHMAIHTHMQTVLDPLPVMNLRSLHSDNDSRAILHPGIRFDLSQSEQAEILESRFDLDMKTALAL